MADDKQQPLDAADSPKPGGRPLKFKSVKKLQAAIDEYFAACDPHPEEVTAWVFHEIEEEYTDDSGQVKTRTVQDHARPPYEEKYWRITAQEPYTITGLANHLKTSRQTLINYEGRPKFFDTIKAAKDRCEEFWELQLLGRHATGPIFNLKNNFDWADKQVLSNDPENPVNPVVRIIDERQAPRNTDTE